MEDNAHPLDRETFAAMAPADHKDELRLWLRLLTCSKLIENGVRKRLRESFDLTLPRFDLMAQLDRADNGVTLGDLSRRMMVSNGNITSIVDALIVQGLVSRIPSPNDKRVQIVRLTTVGHAEFRRIAYAHEDWMADAFSGLSKTDRDKLMALLAKTKKSARRTFGEEDAE